MTSKPCSIFIFIYSVELWSWGKHKMKHHNAVSSYGGRNVKSDTCCLTYVIQTTSRRVPRNWQIYVIPRVSKYFIVEDNEYNFVTKTWTRIFMIWSTGSRKGNTDTKLLEISIFSQICKVLLSLLEPVILPCRPFSGTRSSGFSMSSFLATKINQATTSHFLNCIFYNKRCFT
jgi:hypothetical protein